MLALHSHCHEPGAYGPDTVCFVLGQAKRTPPSIQYDPRRSSSHSSNLFLSGSCASVETPAGTNPDLCLILGRQRKHLQVAGSQGNIFSSPVRKDDLHAADFFADALGCSRRRHDRAQADQAVAFEDLSRHGRLHR